MVADFYVSRCLRVVRARFRASLSRRASGGVRPRCDRWLVARGQRGDRERGAAKDEEGAAKCAEYGYTRELCGCAGATLEPG